MQYFPSKGCENRRRGGVEMIDRSFIERFSFETLLEEKGFFFDSLIFFLVK